MVFNPFLKQFMYGIHTPDLEIPIVINKLENPIYKEEEKINCTSELTCQILTNLIQHAVNTVPNRIDQERKKLVVS